MSRWRKSDEQTDFPSENDPAEPFPPASTLLSLSDTTAVAVVAEETPVAVFDVATVSIPKFCPECGGRLHSSAAYVPKFCTQCGHHLAGEAAPAPLSGLDALLAATAAAKASDVPMGDPAAQATNVTFMGVPRTHVHTKTLMGVSRTELYGSPPSPTRTGANRARVQEVRRARTAPLRFRSVPPPVIPSPATETSRKETRQSGGAGMAVASFIMLLMLAVCAAAVTFWLCRQGIIVLPV